MKLGDLEFKAEDFLGRHIDLDDSGLLIRRYEAEQLCGFANALLHERLEKAPISYGHFTGVGAWATGGAEDTHAARLACIEEL